MKRVLLVPATALAMLLLGGPALAGTEWCDNGSPPPNDWRFRQTGGGSVDSPTAWIQSTTGGTLSFDPYVNTLTGGVAHGMTTALAHAPAQHVGP
ncbi:MAG TPA: hypothetical protein VFC31_09350 [Candidatus Limnocylindria bacterium]|nr:hypothetical protein [Candidatus Limnocylindria bacterium]